MSYSIADMIAFETLDDDTRAAIQRLAKGGFLATSEDCWCVEGQHDEDDCRAVHNAAYRDANALEQNANRVYNAVLAIQAAEPIVCTFWQWRILHNAVDALQADAQIAVPREPSR